MCYLLSKCFGILQVDIQLETGEYFLSDKKKFAKKWQEKQEKQAAKTAESKRKREAAFVPPKVQYTERLSIKIIHFVDLFW